MTEQDRTINDLRRENEKLKVAVKVPINYISPDKIVEAFDTITSASILSPKTDDLTDFWEHSG